MKLYYVIRPGEDPSGFNVIAEDRKSAIKLATETYGYAYGTVAREIDVNIPGILVSKETLLSSKENLTPNFKE